MSEYNDSYNWRRAWLGSDPPQRQTLNSQPKAEPFFQHKRFYNLQDSAIPISDFFTSSNAEEDPYFLIHGHSKSAIAYPNILRRMSKSAQPQSTPKLQKHEMEQRRPKSDEVVPAKELNQHRGHHHSHHHKKSRSKSKEKRPIERWPELKVDLPQDSPDAKPTNTFDEKRPENPPAEVIPETPIKKPKPPADKKLANDLLTEYRREFKKFEAPLPRRSKSASRPIETIQRHPLRPTTGNAQPLPRRRKLQSEYQANYTDMSDFTTVAHQHNSEARQNALVAEGCHFSRRHFSQLDSDTVCLWEPPGSSRSEIVGVNKELRARRLEEYKSGPTEHRSLPVTERNYPVTCLRLPTRQSAPNPTSTYEPIKYIPQAEPKISVLPLERNPECSQERHICNNEGRFLVSRARPPDEDEFYNPEVYSNCASPALSCLSLASMDMQLNAAENTLDRALQRRSQMLISTCRH